jgi:DNA-binding transcriptional regulator YdaS (Cro superfamily)
MAYDTHLINTLKRVGGPTKLARLLNIQPSAVTQWSRIPAERVPPLSDATGIPRHEMRPDLWPAPAEASA